MDGSMGRKAKINPHVMAWARSIAGMMYLAYYSRECAWMAEKAIGDFAADFDEPVGSYFGEALTKVQGSILAEARGMILAGNHDAARVAMRKFDLEMPVSEDVYEDMRENLPFVPADWEPPEDFPVLFR